MFWSGENITLGQRAQKRALEYAERKNRYFEKWLKTLIEYSEEEIMIASGLGKKELTFHIREWEKKLVPLCVEWGSQKKIYEWTMEDRERLGKDLIKYYGDEKNFPYLSCRYRTSESVTFSWDV